jgi:hypothetical protein
VRHGRHGSGGMVGRLSALMTCVHSSGEASMAGTLTCCSARFPLRSADRSRPWSVPRTCQARARLSAAKRAAPCSCTASVRWQARSSRTRSRVRLLELTGQAILKEDREHVRAPCGLPRASLDKAQCAAHFPFDKQTHNVVELELLPLGEYCTTTRPTKVEVLQSVAGGPEELVTSGS